MAEELVMLNLNDWDKPIPMEELFGKDAGKMYDTCKKIMHMALFPYEGCYCAPIPSVSSIKTLLRTTDIKRVMEYRKQWYVEHPEEKKKEEESKAKWDEEYARYFRVLYGISKRHNIHIEWGGNKDLATFCPDKFEVYKHRERIARICV